MIVEILFFCMVSAIGAVIGWDVLPPWLFFSPVIVVLFLLFISDQRWMRYAIFLLTVYTPFEEFILRWLPQSLYLGLRYGNEVLLYLMLVAMLMQKLLNRTRLIGTPVDFYVLVFSAVMAVSGIVNRISLFQILLAIRHLLRYYVLVLLLINLSPATSTIKKWIKTLIAIAMLQAVLGILQAIGGNAIVRFFLPRDLVIGQTMVFTAKRQILVSGTRVFGTLGMYNIFSSFLVFFGLVRLSLYLHTHIYSRRRFFIGTAVILIGIVLSYSRQAFVLTLAGVSIILFLSGKRKLFFAVGVFLTIFLVGIVVMDVSAQRVGEEEMSFVQRVVLQPLTLDYWSFLWQHQRLFILRTGLEVILREAPLLGFGPGTMGSSVTTFFHSTSAVPLINALGNQSHLISDVGWLALYAQYGVLGFIAFSLIIVRLVVFAWGVYRRSSSQFIRGICLAYVAILCITVLQNFAMYTFEIRPLSMYFWLFVGFIVVLLARDTNSGSLRKAVVSV